MRRFSLLLAALLSIAPAWAGQPRHPLTKAELRPLPPSTLIERVVVKFQEGTHVRLREGLLVTSKRDSEEDLRLQSAGLSDDQVLRDLATVQWEAGREKSVQGLSRLFKVNESTLAAYKALGEVWSGRELADLNLYFGLTVVPGTTYQDAEDLLGRLNAVPSVELAYALPFPQSAAADFPTQAGDNGQEIKIVEGDPKQDATFDFSNLKQQVNLIQNPDFETGVLSPWFKYPAAAPGIVAVASCCGNQTPGGTWDGYIQPQGQYVELAQNVSLIPGRSYRLQVTLSTKGMTGNLYWYTNVTGDVLCASTNVAWPTVTRLQCDFTAPFGTTAANVHLAGTAPAGKWVTSDDWSLTDTTNQPPTVSLSSPTPGQTFTAPALVQINATASDSDGSVTKVEFFQGTTLLFTDTVAPFAFTWSNVPAGNYSLTARATDNLGATRTSTAVAITVFGSNPQTPFRGAPFAVPGTIQAEDFDNGGEGIAWHDNDPGNGWGSYRTNVDVDIAATGDVGGGYLVANAWAGEWLEYTINVPAAGSYTLEARVASDGPGGTFHVEFDGINKTGSIQVPATGGWDTWQTISRSVSLAAGQQVMRVALDTNGTQPFPAIANLNYFRLTANQPPTVSLTSPTPGQTFTAPATVQLSATASDSDGTVTQVAFYVNSSLLGFDTEAPFTFTWSKVSAGTYSLIARATDNLGAATLSSPVTITVNGGTSYEGYFDTATCSTLTGWAADRNRLNTVINVDLYDGTAYLTSVAANQLRPDVGDYLGDAGYHGFTWTVPASLKDGSTHSLSVKFGGTTTNLGDSPKSITCGSVPVGTGLRGDYYNNTSFSGFPSLTRTEGPIDFFWNTGSPGPGIDIDNFSVLWTGKLRVPSSDTYTFYLFSDDGVRLWVNGQLLVDRWFDQYGPEVPSTPIFLDAGRSYDIRIEYYEHFGGAEIHLSWSSASVPKQIVPVSQLYPN